MRKEKLEKRREVREEARKASRWEGWRRGEEEEKLKIAGTGRNEPISLEG